MKRSVQSAALTLLIIYSGFAPGALAQGDNNQTTTATVTNATGTIAQVNYGTDGTIDGFLIGTNTLLIFPTSSICGGLGALAAAGNSVTYSGTAFTENGFTTVLVTSFTNTTTKATFSASPSASAPTKYGPTSGKVEALNYNSGGPIDGFVFTPDTANAASIFVYTGPRASSTLQSALTVGATVSVTGTTSPKLSACPSTGALEAVDATSLTIGSQTIVIAGGGYGTSPFGSGFPPPSPGGGQR
jgi:hypothetical protein